MKRKVLISCHSLMAGGVEKSLISFLCELEAYKNEFDIDLLVPKQEGMFFDQIPEYVNILQIAPHLHCMNYSFFQKQFWSDCDIVGILFRFVWYLKYNLYVKKKAAGLQQQIMWKFWSKIIEPISNQYDVAISYTNGPSNYLVIDKVEASKKILWLHNEYQKVGYNKQFDEMYYTSADEIITISSSCVDNFVQVFPQLKRRVKILENISSANLIRKLGYTELEDDVFNKAIGNSVILLSVGRLTQQKGFDIALEAAKIMKGLGFNFVWYIIGEGPDYKELIHQRTALGLEDKVVFLGLRKNPYYYIRRCDIFVQPSRYEGKSIVLDEAKILAKPIVVTNYTTVKDSITDGKDGIVTEQQPGVIATTIIDLWNNANKRKELINNLKKEANGNAEEIERYVKLLR